MQLDFSHLMTAVHGHANSAECMDASWFRTEHAVAFYNIGGVSQGHVVQVEQTRYPKLALEGYMHKKRSK